MTAVAAATTTETLNYEIHPAASIFPLIEGAAFAVIVEDIRTNGQIEPVVLDKDGRLIDGRNRVRACQALGIDVKETRYDGDDVTSFVVSKNLARRNLTVQQQAMVAARLANLPRGTNQFSKGAPIGAPSGAEVRDLLNVSVGSFSRAKEITHKGTPDLIALADEGSVSLALASDVAKAEPAVQDEWVKQARNGAKPPRPAAVRKIKACANAVPQIKASPESTHSERHAAKWERIAELASTGSTSHQIADDVGMSRGGVCDGAKQRGIDIRADRIVGKSRHLDSNRIIRESVTTLENVVNGLNLVNYSDIDKGEADTWIDSLNLSRNALLKAIRQIEKRKSIQ